MMLLLSRLVIYLREKLKLKAKNFIDYKRKMPVRLLREKVKVALASVYDKKRILMS